MYGLFIEKDESWRVWLDRLLIDHRYQGKGYGKTSVKVLIEHILRKYGNIDIYLSVYEKNKHAIQLYINCGFKFNGALDYNGEKVMVLKSGK